MGLTESHWGTLGDTPGFVQLISGKYKSDKPINITGIDKIDLKDDFTNGSIVNGIREPILYSFVLSSPPGHKKVKQLRIKLFKETNKPVLSHQVSSPR